MADGFFDEIEDREKGFDKGYTIINDLKDACMLENGERNLFSGSCVKMHDLLRDLAIAVTRKSNQFVVKVRSKVGKFPRDENLMDDVIRVSLMDSVIQMLSCQSKCPKLSTLLLEGSRLGNIDHLFFQHTQNLRVLDLSNTNITCLPQSLSNLVNLHALLLRLCWNLTEVPSLVRLTELRVLDLTGTEIKYLPNGTDGLTNLRCLHLSYTHSLEIVPVGAISSLSNLEELSMAGSKWKWSSNENRNGRGAGVEDIVRLKHLKKLLVQFIEFSAFSSYVRSGHWRALNCFVLTVGYELEFDDFVELQYNIYCRKRRLCVSGELELEEPTQGDYLANLTYIHISNCPKLKYVLSVGWFQTLQNLEGIIVEGCQAMEEMVVDTGLHKEELTRGDTLANLKRIRISNCPKLKYVLSVGWFQTLQNLEEIYVDDCQAMEEIVVDTGLHKEEPTQDGGMPLARMFSFPLYAWLEVFAKIGCILGKLEPVVGSFFYLPVHIDAAKPLMQTSESERNGSVFFISIVKKLERIMNKYENQTHARLNRGGRRCRSSSITAAGTRGGWGRQQTVLPCTQLRGDRWRESWAPSRSVTIYISAHLNVS
ncbi:hypothetical protein AAC387_Pa04g1715 [Persea americana]